MRSSAEAVVLDYTTDLAERLARLPEWVRAAGLAYASARGATAAAAHPEDPLLAQVAALSTARCVLDSLLADPLWALNSQAQRTAFLEAYARSPSEGREVLAQRLAQVGSGAVVMVVGEAVARERFEERFQALHARRPVACWRVAAESPLAEWVQALASSLGARCVLVRAVRGVLFAEERRDAELLRGATLCAVWSERADGEGGIARLAARSGVRLWRALTSASGGAGDLARAS